MTALETAIEELNTRIDAVVPMMETGSGDKIGTVRGEPDELIRRLLSGYVPDEDVDGALLFLTNAAKGLQQVAFNGNSPAAVTAGLRFSAGQLIVTGVLMERARAASC